MPNFLDKFTLQKLLLVELEKIFLALKDFQNLLEYMIKSLLCGKIMEFIQLKLLSKL